MNAASGANTTLSAPLSHINVHIRDGAALLLHEKPAYTIEETRREPYALLVSLAPTDGSAFGTTYIDDGISNPPGPSSTLTIHAIHGKVTITRRGTFNIEQILGAITLLGVQRKPTHVLINGKALGEWTYLAPQAKVVVQNITVNLNNRVTITWT